jgi:Tol biopolymer transport system component
MPAKAPFRAGAGGAALALLLGACQATNVGPATASPATASGSAAASSPSVAPSLCTDTRTPGDQPRTGTLLGNVGKGRILFVMEGASGEAGGTFAFAIIDSAGLHTVATADWTMAHTVWTPDGHILFDSERNDDRHLFRMAADGTGVTQVTSDFRGSEAGAAFVGKTRLVFSHYACDIPADQGLFTAAADGSGMAHLTPGFAVGDPQDDVGPTVSPDGRTVVFIRFTDPDNATGGLWSIPAAGGTATRLTADTKGIFYPRFSPDGKQILFTQPAQPQFSPTMSDSALWLEPVGGGKPRQLTSFAAGTSVFEADWSPDGSEIVAKEYQQGWNFNELHVLRADGTGDQPLWRGSLSTAETPDWGP